MSLDPPRKSDPRGPSPASRGSIEELSRQVAELRRRLEEAEETIRAIREDEVDACVVSGGEDEQVLTLESADRPYRLLVESMQQGALTLSADGTILYGNPRVADLLGRPQDELPGLDLCALVVEEERPACAALLREGRVAGAQGEALLARLDGTTAPAHLAVSPLPVVGAAALCVFVTDLTERKGFERLQLEQAARRESEERLEAVLTAARMATWHWEPDIDRVTASETMEELFGLLPGETWRSSARGFRLVHPDDVDRHRALVEEAVRTGGGWHNELRVVRPRDGQVLWLEEHAHSVRDPHTGKLGFAGLVWDITERKRAEAAAREGKERLQLALSAARMGIWTWDVATDTQTRDANLNRLLGLEPVETTQPFSEFLEHIHPDDRETVAQAFDSSVRSGRPLHLEFRIVRPDGAVRWLRDQGDVFGAVARGRAEAQMAGACVDITPFKEAEAALRESEERLRRIVEGATDYAIFTLDADRRVTSWSPGARATFGYDESEMIGRSADLVFTPGDRAASAPEAEVRTALREGRADDERWHVRKDRSRFYASGVLTTLGEGGSLGFVKILRDLTDRKRMEDALRRSRDELEARVDERTAELARANDALTELLRRLVTAQEDERRRVARDLHDRLGQELTALILGLKELEQTIPDEAPGRERLREVEATVGRIGQEAHDLAVELRPTALDDLGLGAALATYVARWSERTGVAADLQAAGLAGDRLPPEIETTFYRVVQEALNNVAKHAEARRVSVIVERGRGEVMALIEDDGRGFEPGRGPPRPDRRRLGLLGMRERVAQTGGTLLVESAEGAGTTVRVRIPLRETSRESRP